MKRYRCKHAVEAMRWDGVSRELLTAWHERKVQTTPWFRENGGAVVHFANDWHVVQVGEWLVWSAGEFVAVDDEMFTTEYEAEDDPASHPTLIERGLAELANKAGE